VFNFVALGFHKKFGPEHNRGDVVWAHEFGLGASASVEFLFAGSVDDGTAPKSHGGSSVTFEVRVNCESRVDKPTNDIESVCGQNKFIVDGFEKKEHQTEEFAPIILIGGLDSSAKGGHCELNVGASPLAKEECLRNESVEGLGFFGRQFGRSAGVV